MLYLVFDQSIACYDHSIRADRCNASNAWFRLVLVMASAALPRSIYWSDIAIVHAEISHFSALVFLQGADLLSAIVRFLLCDVKGSVVAEN